MRRGRVSGGGAAAPGSSSSQPGGSAPFLLDCRGVGVRYGNVHALAAVDFAVRDGEVAALLGANGAGKSTLLKVVAGLSEPQRGRVRFADEDITRWGAERRVRAGITMIPGEHAVFPSLSVLENLRLFAHALARERARVDAAIASSLDVFPRLRGRAAQPAATLSGGEQRMLALARALILRPRLLLVDELSLGLAPTVVRQLLGALGELNRDGTAVVLVEQSPALALRVAHRAYLIQRGEIRFAGPADDLLDNPVLLRAALLGAPPAPG